MPLGACKCPHHEGVGKGDKIKMDEMGGAYDTWETGNACRVLGGKPEGRSLLRRPRCSWEVIKMIFK